MSVPKTSINFSLDDILASLEVRLEIEDAIEKLPLTQTLGKCLLFAESSNLTDLTEFIKQELDGYRSQTPNYRIVQLSYFDDGGQLVNGLNQYRIYPLDTGVRKLELHLKNGLTLMLPPQILSFLSQAAGRKVDSGHVSPTEISQLLEKIQDSVSKKIKNYSDR